MDPIATAVLVARHLDGLQIAHTIGGSIASSSAGEPRATIGIDFVVALDERQVDALAASLAEAFYVDVDALRRAVRTKTSANLIHRETQLKVDLCGRPARAGARGGAAWRMNSGASVGALMRATPLDHPRRLPW